MGETGCRGLPCLTSAPHSVSRTRSTVMLLIIVVSPLCYVRWIGSIPRMFRDGCVVKLMSGWADRITFLPHSLYFPWPCVCGADVDSGHEK